MLIAHLKKPQTVRRSGLFFARKAGDTMDKPGLRDALPQPRQSDTHVNDPFWARSIAACLPQRLQHPQTSEPVAKRDLDVGLGDVAHGVGAGAPDLVGGIGELARQASNFGKENAGKQGATTWNRLVPIWPTN